MTKLSFWKVERGQQLCWWYPGLWGWSAGGSSQGDLGWAWTQEVYATEIVMHLTSWQLDFNFSSRKRQAPQLKARKSLEIGSWHCGIWNALQKPAWHIHLSGTRGKATSKNLREKGWYWILSLQLLRSFSWKDWWDQWITRKWTRKRSWERKLSGVFKTHSGEKSNKCNQCDYIS